MAEASGSSEPEVSEQEDDQKKPMLPKQESLVLYSQAALSAGRMSSRGSGRKGRRPPRPLLLTAGGSDSPDTSSNQRRPLLKQSESTDQGLDNTGRRLTHQDTPDIVISSECDVDVSEADDEDDGPRTPLPVLPIVLPEPDSDDENAPDQAKRPTFLGVTQRYRRSSLVRMDAIKPQGSNTLEANPEEPVRRKISVHGSLDLPKNTLKDLIGFRNAKSFNVESDDEETVAISELHTSVNNNLLNVPTGKTSKFKRKGSKRKRPSLRRLLTISVEPQLDREALEQRHNSRKKEKEERKKERKERKLREKRRLEEEMYDEDGVSTMQFSLFLHSLSSSETGALQTIH